MPMSAHQGLLFRQLSDDVVMVVVDGVELAGRGGREARGDRRTPRPRHAAPRWWSTDDALVGLRLADGTVLERQALVVASQPHVRADFLSPLGVTPEPFEMGGAVHGSVLAVSPTGATAVPGLYAAGNATDISMTLMASAAHGMRVGAFINAELAGADAGAAVAARRELVG